MKTVQILFLFIAISVSNYCVRELNYYMNDAGYYLFNVVQFIPFLSCHFSNVWFNGQFALCFLSGRAVGLGAAVKSQLTPPPPPSLPVQTHLLCLPLGRRKIIRYFNGCQICFPNLLKGYRCYTRTSAYIWINVNFVTREIYCPPWCTGLIGMFSQSAAWGWFIWLRWLTALW